MPTFYLASHNRHKANEIQEILGPAWRVLSCRDIDATIQWDETGSTFEANALIKAQALLGKAERLILADDSGLEVDALNGAPGIYSARYAGEGASDKDNLDKLVHVLRDVPDSMRQARFVGVICCVGLTPDPLFFRGECSGTLLKAPVGGGGFGYDPIFVPDGNTKTFAELGDKVKNRISHRGRALAHLQAYLKSRAL